MLDTIDSFIKNPEAKTHNLAQKQKPDPEFIAEYKKAVIIGKVAYNNLSEYDSDSEEYSKGNSFGYKSYESSDSD